jgi:serine/threonine protein kinase
MVEQYGDGTQEERIQRELLLRSKVHPNLIEIYDGGSEIILGVRYYYVVMEYLPWSNLKDFLPKVGLDMQRSIIRQVALAALFLENNGICHRDIKPENVCISSDGANAKLLDLGIIRPVRSASITDQEARHFIGTLRYAPPEFLFRREKQSIEGFRAITFYQLGGILHDLIMKRPLFEAFSEPYALLVHAVEFEKPRIECLASEHRLADLARCCLLKVPDRRLELVRWEDFLTEPSSADAADEIRAKISKRRALSLGGASTGDAEFAMTLDARLLASFTSKVTATLRRLCADSEIFPRYQLFEKPLEPKGVTSVILYFEPDTKWSPDHHCYTVFEIEQAEDNVFSIRVNAGFARELSSDKIPSGDEEASRIWSGQAESTSLDKAIRDTLMEAVEKFLEIRTDSGTVRFGQTKYGNDVVETN